MSVAENIGYALKVSGVPKDERLRQVREIARAVELEPYLDRKPANLSGGQRQRVAMARAMIRRPKVFLFDEPLSNLDALLRVQMRAEIRKLHRQLGTTSVFVTHDQAEAMTLADKLVVMRAGRVEQVGTPNEVYGRPASRYVAGFIGSPPMNLIEGGIGPSGAFVPGADGSAKLELGRADLAGRAVAVGLRPETLKFGAPASDSIGLTGVVDFVEEFGASRVVHFSWGGKLLAALVTEPVTLNPGDRLPVSVDLDAIHLFGDTGERMPQAERAMEVA